MMTIRRSNTLGTSHSGGQILRCYFAFADYQDQAHTHEGRLRAVNNATLLPNSSYQIGPEAAVDIVTWVRSGTLTTAVDDFPAEDIRVKGLHLISTGTGCSTLQWKAGEQGASFIQFWFLPDIDGTTPAQEKRPSFSEYENGGFQIIASGFPEDDPEELETSVEGAPIALNARARLLHAAIPGREGAAYSTTPGRDLYFLVVSGCVTIEGETLHEGDAVALESVTELTVIAKEDSEVLLADVAS